MSDHMKKLLGSTDNTEAIARVWPVIKEVLVEQLLITSAEDEEHGDKKLKGFAVAYRALEKFQLEGKKTIEASEKDKQQTG